MILKRIKVVVFLLTFILLTIFSDVVMSERLTLKHLPCKLHHNCSVGVYGENVESPDGTTIMYAEIHEESSKGHIVLLNKEKKNTKRIGLDKAVPHNAAKQYWESDRLVVFQDGYQKVVLYNVWENKKVKELHGKVGLLNRPGFILVKKDRKNDAKEKPGIYEYDIKKDFESLVASYSEIESKVCSLKEDCQLLDIWNIKSNLKYEYIFRGDFYLNQQEVQYLILIKRNGELLKKALPIHFFLEQEKIYGTVGGVLHEFNNWSSSGRNTKIKANHFDLSEGLLATDSEYFSKPVFLKVCKIETGKCKEVFRSPNSGVVWYKNYHINPTFNENGTRLYFNFPLGKDKVVVSYVDL